MDQSNEQQRQVLSLIALNLGSLMLLAGAIYLLKELAYLYGIGIGASITLASLNIASSSINASAITQLVTQITMLHDGLLESYAIFLIALVTVGASLIIFIRRNDRASQRNTATYALLHSAFTVFYILMLYILLSTLYPYLKTTYLYVIYLGILLCLASDAYIQYAIRQPAQSSMQTRTKSSVTMDPAKPFSNVLALQQEVFGKLSGELKIVDKHFNSAALENFHRLTERSLTNFTKVVILTSKSMMDSSFGTDIIDFKKELSELGVGLEVKLMDDKDAVEQHERFMMDDKIAYKIPPFNIINKRSEHITKMSFSDADKRFRELYGRAIKMENYAVKKGRDNQDTQPE